MGKPRMENRCDGWKIVMDLYTYFTGRPFDSTNYISFYRQIKFLLNQFFFQIFYSRGPCWIPFGSLSIDAKENFLLSTQRGGYTSTGGGTTHRHRMAGINAQGLAVLTFSKCPIVIEFPHKFKCLEHLDFALSINNFSINIAQLAENQS